MAGLFDVFLDAYTAPNQRAQEQQTYERAAPQRTADAWGRVNSQMDELANPKPDLSSVERYDPLANPTSSIQMPKQQRKLGPLEMQKAKLSAMISSGDKTLQTQALSMLPEYYKQQNTTGKAPGSLSTYGKQAEDMGYKYGTKDYYKRVDELQREGAKSDPLVTVNTGDMPTRVQYLTREEKLEGGLNPDVPYVLDNQGNPKPVALGAGEDSISQANTMNLVSANFEDMLFGEDGIYGDGEFGADKGIPALIARTVKGNYERWAKDDPRFSQYEDLAGGMISNIARGLGGEKGPLSDGDMLRVKGLVPSVAGINVDTKETAMKKLKVLQQLVEVKKTRGVVDKKSLDRIMEASGMEKPKVKEWDPSTGPKPGVTWVE